MVTIYLEEALLDYRILMTSVYEPLPELEVKGRHIVNSQSIFVFIVITYDT